MTDRNEKMIAGLLAEREGYARSGRADRAAAVDAQLKHYGYEPPEGEEPSGSSPAEQRAASQAEKDAPKRRGRPQQQTAEQTGKSEA